MAVTSPHNIHNKYRAPTNLGFAGTLFIVLYERTLLTYAIPLAAPRITPEANVNAAT